MPARSLASIARQACIRNIRSIYDVGDAPYEVVRSILLRIDNAEQLKQIEQNSPQICGPDAEAWKLLVKRDIPNWEPELNQPKSPRGWYKFYKKLLEKSQLELAENEQALKAKLNGIKSEQAQHTAKQVDLNIVRLPKGVDSNAEVIRLPRNSTFFRGVAGQSRSGGRETRASSSGKSSKIAQIRREAMALSRFPKKDQPGVIGARDTKKHTLPKIAAPPSMLREYRNPVSPRPVDPMSGHPTTKKRNLDMDETEGDSDELRQRERRLQELKTQREAHKTTDDQEAPRMVRVPRRPPTTRDAKGHHDRNVLPAGNTEGTKESGGESRESTQLKAPTRLEAEPNEREPNDGSMAKAPTKRVVRLRRAPANPFIPIKRQKVF